MSKKFISIPIYFNPERDAALLTWLAGQKNKAAAVREALWAYIQAEANHPAVPSQVPAQAIIDPVTIYQAIDAALAERLDLTVIRQVVEAAVSQSLAGLPFAQAYEVEDEADTILSVLDDHLVME